MIDFDLKQIRALIVEALQEKPTGDAWLDVRYHDQKAIVGHTQPYYRLFYLMAKALKPGIVVELGGWQGTAAAHFASGSAETVITIDHHSDPGDDLNQVKMLEVVRRYDIKYLQGWTTPGYAEEYPEKGAKSVFEDVKQILGNDKIDILFIDSWHEGRYFRRDWEYYSPLLADNALVICDDVFDSEFFVDMVATFENLPGEKFTHGGIHPGSVMGFIKYDTRPAKTAKPRIPRKRRTTAKKAA